MAEALYRKYRPSRFDELVGQDHIETTLRHAIEQDKLSHAYLFCGPRGTGKTTSARLLAKALLCVHGPSAQPDGSCEECQAIAQGTHPDVYELDAASRTGVESVREEIIANVQYAPVRGRFKIYIIDEVHMLSNAAFNALLKTLEEPPAHVVFILCTTDPQKITDTIVSRCQRFDFRRITSEGIISRLAWVCDNEGVSYEKEALVLLAAHAQGGMRDALVLLEQLISYSAHNITKASVEELFGLGFNTYAQEIVLAALRGNLSALFEELAKAQNQGVDLGQLLEVMAGFVRDLLVVALTNNKGLCLSVHLSDALCVEFCGRDNALRLQQAFECLMDALISLKKTQNTRLLFEHTCLQLARIYAQPATHGGVVEELASSSLAGGVASFKGEGYKERATAASKDKASVSEDLGTAAALPSRSSNTQIMINQQPREDLPINTIQAQKAPDSNTKLQECQALRESVVYHANVEIPSPVWRGLNNEAALQRLWLALTKKAKKENQALSVMLLGAQFSFDAALKSCIIHIPEGNFYTFEALQKEEYVNTLSGYFKECATALIPFKICIAAQDVSQDNQVVPSSSGLEQDKPLSGDVSVIAQASHEELRQGAPSIAQGASLDTATQEPVNVVTNTPQAETPAQQESQGELQPVTVPPAKEMVNNEVLTLPSAGLGFLPADLQQKVAAMAQDSRAQVLSGSDECDYERKDPSYERAYEESRQTVSTSFAQEAVVAAVEESASLIVTRPRKIAPGETKTQPRVIRGLTHAKGAPAQAGVTPAADAPALSALSTEADAPVHKEASAEGVNSAEESAFSEEELKDLVRSTFGEDVVFS